MRKIAKILGSGGAIPISGKAACSEIIYVNKSDFVLIDAGFGIAQAISKSGEKYENLNSIFITHYHTDHICDLPTILFSYFLSTKRKSVKIYIPQNEQSFIPNLFFNVFGHLSRIIQSVNGYIPQLDLIPFTGETVQISDSKISSLAVKHGDIETFGLSIEFDSLKLSISSDTTYCDSLVKLANNCDILIQDCAFSEDFGTNPLHAVPSQVIQLVNETSAKNVYLNHLMPETIGKEESMHKLICNNVSAKVLMAEDGQDIFI